MLQQPEIPFKIEVQVEAFHKAGAKGKQRRIGGVISTEQKDRQGEVVLQRGLDFSDFLRGGWFNDNHSRETTGIVGYPEKVERRGRGHYVEGYLLEGHEPADKIWSLANSLQKTGRRLGFSIEGNVVSRDGMDGKTVAKARVRNVAITNCPVNTDTGLEVLAKSLQALENEQDQLALGRCNAGCGKCFERALSAGQAVSDPGVAPGEGFALRTESMERNPHNLEALRARRRRKKKLTKAEATAWLKNRYRGMTDAAAERLVAFAARGGST
jgi:hypothetical protein